MIECDGKNVTLQGRKKDILTETIMIMSSVHRMIKEWYGERIADTMLAALYQTASSGNVKKMTADAEMTGCDVNMKELLRQLGMNG